LEPAKDFTRQGDYGRAVAAKSAQSELEKIARDFHSKNPDRSYEQAFTKVLTDPQNRSLMKRAQRERLAALGVA
jgi:hypothetical protein